MTNTPELEGTDLFSAMEIKIKDLNGYNIRGM